MTGRLVRVIVAAAWLASAPARAQTGDGIEVRPILADGRVAAGFVAGAAVGPDVRALVESGLVVTLAFVVELKRPASVWLDRTIHSESVTSSIKFDTLSGTYHVSRMQQGHVTFSDRTREFAEARDWAATFERVPLAGEGVLDPNADYYVEVRMSTRPRRTFSLWPFAGTDDRVGRATFTFIR